MCLALETVREAAGDDVFIIGCGCPVGSAIGMVDGMRVSADTGPTWDPSFPLPWWDNGTLPSVRNMVRNSITRMPLSHRWWHNDPDCLLLGKTTILTDEEVVSAASIIAMSGGMLLLSDDLPSLTQDRFDIATKIFPICEGVARPLDLHCSYGSMPSILQLWCSDDESSDTVTPKSSEHKTGSTRGRIKVGYGLGTWTIVSLSNWLEVDAVVSAPFSAVLHPKPSLKSGGQNGYHMLAFWGSKYVWVPSLHGEVSRQTLSKRLGPHETEIFHIKSVNPGSAQYIGSSLHYSCGYEVKSFSCSSSSATVQIRKEALRSGFIYVFVPSSGDGVSATLDGRAASVEVETRLTFEETSGSNRKGTVFKVQIISDPVFNSNEDLQDCGTVTISF
jgi:hypothetical protein